MYGNSISSDDFEDIPAKGQIYTDENGNVLAVRNVYGNVVAFDKLISRNDYTVGSALNERACLKSIGVHASLYNAFVDFSVSTTLYPFYPIAMVGVDYRNPSQLAFLALAGIGTSANLASLWDLGITFIENGKIKAWCALGAEIGTSISFACSYGVTYSHNIGSFRWEVGVCDLCAIGRADELSACLGLGVDL